MPAEKGSPHVGEPCYSVPVIKSVMNNGQNCDFRIYVNPVIKNKCIMEDDNFFDEFDESKLKLGQQKRIYMEENKDWSYESPSKSEKEENSGDEFPSIGEKCDSCGKDCDKNKPQLKYQFRSELELHKYSMQALNKMIEDLATAIEDVSSQLVSLLQENDTLQQESDARNIAIEQLLKLTVKQTEIELRPVQMSVIIPPAADSIDDWN